MCLHLLQQEEKHDLDALNSLALYRHQIKALIVAARSGADIPVEVPSR